jgi:hypothetical protein
VAALVPGPKHGLPRTAGVFGRPRPGPEQLAVALSRCDHLRTWTRTRGFELDDTPEDLGLLDQALNELTGEARGELGGPARAVRLGLEAGRFLGTVLVVTVPGARWRLWPNGHPVIRLPPGRDLDVVKLGSDRVTRGAPLLADAYAAAAGRPHR